MVERGIQGVNAAEELEELDLLEELPEGDELKPLDDMLQQGSRVVARPSASDIAPALRGGASVPPAGRSSAPPPLPPEARRSSVPPGLPAPRSGIFTIDKDAAARAEPGDGSEADLRQRALQVDRLRLNVRLRDDRIRELERALQAQSRREQELERRAADAIARADALQEQLNSAQPQSDGSAERVRELEQLLATVGARADELERQLNELRAHESADDLKRLPGVGPAFERALARLGVTSFAQIAQWTPEDVLRIAAELNVSPRRIERDGWIARARELCGMTQIGMPAPTPGS
jgi:predicted flap endonuclease-1-like 5' DNA nuclease